MRKLHDPFGEAVYNYLISKDKTPIIVKSNDFDDDIIDTPYLFRKYQQMPALEKLALSKSKGKVLDVGACAGPHSLYLQEKGVDVTALEQSELCCRTMEHRGIKKVINKNIFDYNEGFFDTILLLMNGSGIAGTLDGFRSLLYHCKKLLNIDGQILLDTSDLIYLYENEEGMYDLDLNMDHYYGEIKFWLEYKDRQCEPFKWLYIDQSNLRDIAEETGFSATILEYGDHYDYLVKLSLKK